jgi:Ni,Fe-hydrogenase III large subunit/NADH:ubiquinone oxidoreductase subunit C
MTARPTIDAVGCAVHEGGATAVTIDAAAGTVECRTPAHALLAFAGRLAGVGLEVQWIAAADTRASRGQMTLAYHFAPPVHRPAVTAHVDVDDAFPSLATRSFAASRFEREIQDLFGLVATGHPDPRRLALHQFWPQDYHPLLRDATPPATLVDDGRAFPFRHVEGPGVFEITVGPVHAGIIEPGHFRFSVEGETIANLETRLGFVHKGTEKLFEQLPLARAPELAERISGDTSVAHALALCQALESLAGVRPPERASWLRVLLLELERLYNHVGDVGMILNDTGYAFGHAHCFRLRERLLRLNARLTGHRLLRGAVVAGGVAGPIASADLERGAREVDRIVAEFIDVARLALDNTMVLERLQGTGRLTNRTAREMQVVGLVGRASGIDADARRDAPFAAYDRLPISVPVYGDGDVWSRTTVRIDEARQSATLIAEVAHRAPAGPLFSAPGRLRAGAQAIGLVEGWRGPIWHWALAGEENALARLKVMDPSFRNWPALEYAVLNNIVPDFPLCNKSFNLSYSGNDL